MSPSPLSRWPGNPHYFPGCPQKTGQHGAGGWQDGESKKTYPQRHCVSRANECFPQRRAVGRETRGCYTALGCDNARRDQSIISGTDNAFTRKVHIATQTGAKGFPRLDSETRRPHRPCSRKLPCSCTNGHAAHTNVDGRLVFSLHGACSPHSNFYIYLHTHKESSDSLSVFFMIL